MSLVGLKSWCWQSYSSSGDGENLFPCLFQFLEVTCIPWLMGASLWPPLAWSHLSLWCWPHTSCLQGPLWWYLGTPGFSPHLNILNLIMSENACLPWKGASSQVLGMRMWTSSEPFFCLPQFPTCCVTLTKPSTSLSMPHLVHHKPTHAF